MIHAHGAIRDLTVSRGRARTTAGAALALALLLVGCTSSQAVADEADRIAEALALKPGMRVADVGAGEGRWSVDLAQRVGAEGHVYATEVDDDELEQIRDRVADDELDNVTAIRGDQEDTGLPDGCCDAILLRLVYHHFTDPAAMRASMRRALRPGGVVAVIELNPLEHLDPVPDTPERGGHGIVPEDLVAEMTADGFTVVTRYDDWPGRDDRFCIVFRPEPLSPVTPGF
jgi:SAM-dependent methyltransferase